MNVLCILGALFLVGGVSAEQRFNTVNRDDWVEPHAWTRSSLKNVRAAASADESIARSPETCECEECLACPESADTSKKERSISNDDQGEFFYRKLVNFLINERHMKYDAVSEQFHRTLHIQLSREQYERIRVRDGDLRDVDGVLQDIWQQSKQGNLELMHEVLWSWSESIQNAWSNLLANRMIVNSLQFVLIVSAYFWAKHHDLNVGLVTFAATAFYVYRYLDGECHRKLDIERIADLMNQNGHNPCEEKDPSWYAYVFGGSRREECIKFLESRSEKTCTIKDIYEGFMQEFVMDGIAMFFTTFVRITANIRNTYGYIGMLVVTVLIYANIGVLITAIFKHVIGPLISSFRNPTQTNQRPESVGPQPAEHLTGPMIERLLTITESSTKLANTLSEKLSLAPGHSGVEILARENSSPAILAASTKSNNERFPHIPKVFHTNHSSSSSVQSLPLPDSGESSKGPCSSKSSSVIGESEMGSTDDGDRHFPDDWQGDSASEDDIVILEHFEETEDPLLLHSSEKPSN